MDAHLIDPRLVRTSPIAGTWYPGSPNELAKTVDALLARVEPTSISHDLMGLISPHAGIAYSGQTAAYAYHQLQDKKFDLIVLLGPSHFEDFGPCAISAKKFYSTPLGEIRLDDDFIADLAEKITLTRVENDHEHSLEIQLPFLQRVLGNFSIVPIMMSLPFYLIGSSARETCEKLAAALADLTPSRKVLLLASSDLSHLYDYHAVQKNDARFAELIEAFDIPELARYMAEARVCRACGDAPVVTLLLAAKKLGADRARVLFRTNSGDVTGNRAPGQYTVGYMAAGVYKIRNSL